MSLTPSVSIPLVYCDHNFVVVAHDAGPTYQNHLRQLVSQNKLRFVLSTWHWLEMARDSDRARGLSVAAFADSLSPAWLFERLTVQRREVEDAFFHSLSIAHQRAPRLGSLAEVLADLTGADTGMTGTYRDSRAFVRHMQTLGDNHPMNASLRSNFEAQKHNGESYRAGRLTPEMLRCLDKIMIGRFLPVSAPNGSKIEVGDKDKFLQSCQNDQFPSIAVEAGLTLEGWQTGRTLNDRAFRDSQHIIALPYVELFVTDDVPLTAAIRRVTTRFPFHTAEVITKAEFDKRFPYSSAVKCFAPAKWVFPPLPCPSSALKGEPPKFTVVGATCDYGCWDWEDRYARWKSASERSRYLFLCEKHMRETVVKQGLIY